MSTTKDIMATTKIILMTSADWEEWNKRFMNQVIMYDLLRHIQGNENLLSKPIRPVTADYPQKARSTMARSRTQTHAETGTSEGQTSLEPDRQEVTFSDLSADGQKSFSMAWTFYQDDTKAYENSKTSFENSKNGLPLMYPLTIKKPVASRLNQWQNGTKI
jgi:hypothetical protein